MKSSSVCPCSAAFWAALRAATGSSGSHVISKTGTDMEVRGGDRAADDRACFLASQYFSAQPYMSSHFTSPRWCTSIYIYMCVCDDDDDDGDDADDDDDDDDDD